MEESLEIGLRAMRSNQKMSDMNTFEIKNIYIYISSWLEERMDLKKHRHRGSWRYLNTFQSYDSEIRVATIRIIIVGT